MDEPIEQATANPNERRRSKRTVIHRLAKELGYTPAELTAMLSLLEDEDESE